ncbi:thermonuclease family protein [Chamaesiphon sp.]|uniref:thermonuclease family protein n=1 Tax=Chamaesiphon sp. TaxID=2814140 RepID=UPI00359489C8
MTRSLRSGQWLSIWGLLLIVGCQASPPQYPTVQISRVTSGQSVEWIDKSQQPPVIQQGRLIGIDAPDLAQEPWGKQAKQRLEELIDVGGKGAVSIEFEDTATDKYGRKFVYLWKDGRLLNEQLLKDGWVLATMRTPTAGTNTLSGVKYRERLIRGSQYARLMGAGIWNPEQPMRMSPSEFRKEER